MAFLREQAKDPDEEARSARDGALCAWWFRRRLFARAFQVAGVAVRLHDDSFRSGVSG